MIQIQPFFYFLAAFTLLILPIRWVLAAAVAAIIHELCHITALVLINGRITSVSITAQGCVIESQPLERWQQFVSILAGPLGGFCLLLFRRYIPEIAVCGLFHSMYNLIPVLPLDGGRLVNLLLECWVPEKAEQIMVVIAWVFIGFVGIAGIWAMYVQKYGTGCISLAALLFLRLLPRKIPCKPSQIKVQ